MIESISPPGAMKGIVSLVRLADKGTRWLEVYPLRKLLDVCLDAQLSYLLESVMPP